MFTQEVGQPGMGTLRCTRRSVSATSRSRGASSLGSLWVLGTPCFSNFPNGKRVRPGRVASEQTEEDLIGDAKGLIEPGWNEGSEVP